MPRGGPKRLTPYNKFMQHELARLKADQPEMSHTDRFKLVMQNWKNASENPSDENPSDADGR